jgi:hypothetical protein
MESCHADYGCYHPLKDVVAVPYDPKMVTFLANTQNATLEERFRNKKKCVACTLLRATGNLFAKLISRQSSARLQAVFFFWCGSR